MRLRKQTGSSPVYGTWIRRRAIVVFGLLTAMGCVLSLAAFVSPWAVLFLVPSGVFGWVVLVLSIGSHRLSDDGGRYQARIHGLLASRVSGKRVLDIGCGNGHLAIQLAKQSPESRVTGLDYWGTAWEYSKEACERNARLEGVSERVSFVRGSAAALRFADAEFDCVVSCLTFHEVRELRDKTESLTEALRVLRPGGIFVLLDLFASSDAFPRPQLVRERLEAGGAVGVSEDPLSSLMPLPFPLNGKRFLNRARLISGEKPCEERLFR